MDEEEITRSIRLSLAAELDAINFYMQQSKLIPDGSFKKVHEDIAKEEVTHFGEFLRLLYEYEPSEFEKIKEGWDEASGLLKSGKAKYKFLPGQDESGKGDDASMNFEKDEYLSGLSGFRIVEWDQDGVPVPEDQQKVLPIQRLTYEFTLSKDTISAYREGEFRKNAVAFKRKLNRYLMLDQKLSIGQRSEVIKAGDWSKSGSILADVAKALEKLYENGYSHDLRIIASPSAFQMLLRQSGDSGQTELDLIRELVQDVEVCHALEGEQIYVIHNESFWILVREAPHVNKISETADIENYAFECRLSSLLFDHNASIKISYSRK